MPSLQILFEDKDLIVVNKPYGISSQSTPQENGLVDQLKVFTSGPIYAVHRLDTTTRGIMVYAKTPASAEILSRSFQDRNVKKTYLAIVQGVPESLCGTMEDELYHDVQKNKSFVAKKERKGTKHASLEYTLLESMESKEYGTLSLVQILLHTGRTHQIRVQFASRGLPLLGDGKYGGNSHAEQSLFCNHLVFPHPTTKKQLEFSLKPNSKEFMLFSSLGNE